MASRLEKYTHGHHESVVSEHRKRTAAEAAAFLLPHLRPGMRLLDVGCGPGSITIGLAEAVAPGEVLAIDLSPDVLDDIGRYVKSASCGGYPPRRSTSITEGHATRVPLEWRRLRILDRSKWRSSMGVERDKIEVVYREIRRLTDTCDWDAWADLLAEDATFVNSMLDEPIRGKEAIRAFMSSVPTTIVNHTEWVAIDGNRLAMGWNERQRADAPVYRGFSTLVFDEHGRIESYEGMFDTAAFAAATAA